PALRPKVGELRSRVATAVVSFLWWQCGTLLSPAEMLAAVESDHLTRHCRRGEDETDRCGDLLRTGAASQRKRGALARELFFALAWARQRRAWPDAVDPDARGERERHRLGQSPEPSLADRVGDEIRRQAPHPLIEHVD